MLHNMILPGEVNTARLPKEYQEVECIQSSGTQYIDTGFIPDQDTRIVMNVLLPIQSTTQFMFGSRASSTSRTYSFTCNSTKYRSHYNTSWTEFAASASYTTPFVLDKNKNVTTLNGEHTVTETYAAFTCPYSLILFGVNDSGTIKASAIATLYSCQIYDNGTLVRDFVPCYRKADGAIGLFDVVNKLFYTNGGSGTFIKGADVTGSGSSGSSLEFTYSGNYTDNRVNGKGTVRFNTTGTLTVISGRVTVSAYILGAGGGGAFSVLSGTYRKGSGGGGGMQTVVVTLEPGTYEIVIGTGGAGKRENASITAGNGGNTIAFGYTSTGGEGGQAGGFNVGGEGGSPNGNSGSGVSNSSYASLAGGKPNGGAATIDSAAKNNGGDGYVELTFI